MPRPDPAYDIVLDGKGYMLARSDPSGRGGRAWQVEAQGASIAQQTPTETRYGNQNPLVELPMVWRTWHLGYGLEKQTSEGRYHWAENVDCRFPEMLLPGPEVHRIETGCDGNVVAFAEQGGQLFFAGGRYVRRLDVDDSVIAERDLGTGKAAVDLEVFNGALYVSLGFAAGDYIHRRGADGTWSQDDDVQLGQMVVLNDRLAANVNAYQVKSVEADPMVAANWGAAYDIGDPGVPITALAGLGDLLYVGKQDGLYVLDSSGISTEAIPELRGYRSALNCQGMKAWHGMLWVPHLRGLFLYDSGGEGTARVISCGPGRDAVSGNPVRGRVTAVAGDDRWLYAALYNSNGDTYILAGREAQEGEPGPMVWHPLAKLAGVRCDAMHVSGAYTNPRLFFGMGADVGYIVLPRDADNPLQDANCTYALSGSVYLPAHSWLAPTTAKIWKQVEIEAEGLSLARYVDVYYRVDGGSWRLAGRATVSPKHVLALNSPQGVSGTRIEIRLDLGLPLATTPIVVRSVVVRGVERPSLVELIAAQVRCADELPLRTGARCPRTGAEMLAELKALASATRPVLLKDIVGSERYVVVLGPVSESEVIQEGQLAREVVATVRMAVFSAATTVVAAPNYGQYGRATYDSGVVYKRG